MAATPEQMTTQQQNLKCSMPAPQKSNNSIQSSVKSIKSESRPSFSIALPPSCSQSSLLSNKSIFPAKDADSLTGSTGFFGNRTTARRSSIHFIPDEDDFLINHEAKRGLPKTPYPTTEEEDKRIQNSLFFKH